MQDRQKISVKTLIINIKEFLIVSQFNLNCHSINRCIKISPIHIYHLWDIYVLKSLRAFHCAIEILLFEIVKNNKCPECVQSYLYNFLIIILRRKLFTYIICIFFYLYIFSWRIRTKKKFIWSLHLYIFFCLPISV